MHDRKLQSVRRAVPCRETKQDSMVLDRSALRASLPASLYSPRSPAQSPTQPPASSANPASARVADAGQPEDVGRPAPLLPSRLPAAAAPFQLSSRGQAAGPQAADAPTEPTAAGRPSPRGVERPLPASLSALPWEPSAQVSRAAASASAASQLAGQLSGADTQTGTGACRV